MSYAAHDVRDIIGTPLGDRLLALILEASPDLIYIYDRIEERYLFFGASCATILGYTPHQLLSLRGAGLQQWIHPEDLAHAQAQYAKQEQLSDTDVSMAAYRVRHATGDYKLIRCRQKVFLRTADNNRVRCVLGVGTDITDEARGASELNKLRTRVLRIRGDERRRIAHRLHATAMQHLVGAALLLKSIEANIEDAKAISILSEVRGSLSKALLEFIEPLRD